MKRTLAFVSAVGLLAATPVFAGTRGSVHGEYVEARTAEVFTGGCIMSSEAGTAGRHALVAWHVTDGTWDGVALNGLTVMAALAGNVNLGIHEVGGETATVQSVIFVDQRATGAQRAALVAMAKQLSKGLLDHDIKVEAAPIAFTRADGRITVAAREATLVVGEHLVHDPSCGAMQWFHPLVPVQQATLGMTDQNSFTGSEFGCKWSSPNVRSSFFGTFAY
ncbi:MAG TPA: DUF1326 domain-containing protein [Vicinamibacterales bacterium]|nr:DUF1326 domain-containing protein [Vicinamibacterales bacterium]